MEVIDRDGSKRDLVWLKGQYGAGIEYHAAAEYPRFELQQVFITEGPTILRFTVLAADGKPCVGQPVAYSFPSLGSPSGELPEIPAGATRSRWFGRACIERCDPRGGHEFQIGSESWIKNQVGPYAVAVISPSTYSDCLSGVGWLGGTNHRGPCEFVFREVLGPDGGGGGGGGGTPAGEVGDVVSAIDRLTAAVREGCCELQAELIGLGSDVDAILTGVDWLTRAGKPAPTSPYALGRPLDEGVGSVSQWFGDNSAFYAPLAGHEGLDYACPAGSQVLAAHAGRVVDAHAEGPYGLHVVLQDDASGLSTVYGHLARALVSAGQTLEAGQLLGLSGDSRQGAFGSGRSTGAHLHLGVKLAGVRNPAYGDWLDPVLFRKLVA